MNLIVLITGTIPIIIFSWYLSIKHKRYHGIPRFIAFESIFILALLNYRVWFQDVFSIHQIISWILLILSLYLASYGFYLLIRKGNPGANFENTSKLVKSGIFGYIRHPLYLSVFLLGMGVLFKDPERIQIILGIVIFITIIITSLVEEREMIAKFGDEYKDYMKETKMFIPFIV